MLRKSLWLNDGAKLTGERVFDVGASSSSVPGNGAKKFLMLVIRLMITVQLGTPRGRYDEYNSKVFPQ
jgi:hypothetical protein